MNREEMMSKLANSGAWDVVVIGGGATGLGAALDATSRGFRTLLLESSDFAKGTSSRSTKLIHGGVRYLRSGQIRMVRESLSERTTLLRNASHLVQPIRFAIPSYRRGSRWYYYVGMKAYDLLAGKDGLQNSEMLSLAEISQCLPSIEAKKLRGGVAYTDCQFDDARLAVELAHTIVDNGGLALNYARVVNMERVAKNERTVTFRDQETDQEHEIQARVVVNATGVFAADIMDLDPSESRDERPRVVPSQGSHVVLPREFLPTDCAMMIPDTDDGRVLFAIPWHGRTLLGTTDHLVDEISLEPRPLQSEIDYLLEHASRYLQKAPQRSDVLAVFSGLRPLVGKRGKDQSTATLSREHEIHVSPTGLITVIGGKWTTYRKMGQDVIDLAIATGGLESRPSLTASLKIHGCPDGPNAPEDTYDASLAIYGTMANEIRQLITSQPTLGAVLHERLPFVEAQVVWAARHEMARTVEDVLARRLRALFLDAKAAMECAPRVAALMAQVLDMPEEWERSQVTDFNTVAAAYVCD